MMRDNPKRQPEDAPELMGDIRRALWAGEEREVTVPALVDLARLSAEGSETWRFALRNLASIAAETDPWGASLLARRLLELFPDDDAGWAALGLAQSMLGNLRYSAHCYERALAVGGPDLSCLHNLGHLYDVAFDRPAEAVKLLSQAFEASRDVRSSRLRAEIVSSYAHALARAGEPKRALEIVKKALPRGRTREHAALVAWIESQASR